MCFLVLDPNRAPKDAIKATVIGRRELRHRENQGLVGDGHILFNFWRWTTQELKIFVELSFPNNRPCFKLPLNYPWPLWLVLNIVVAERIDADVQIRDGFRLMSAVSNLHRRLLKFKSERGEVTGDFCVYYCIKFLCKWSLTELFVPLRCFPQL
jgi:hypothetical protein